MTSLLTILPYVICGVILWFIVLQCAPIGSTISLWEVLTVVFLLGVAQTVWKHTMPATPHSWLLDAGIHFVVLALLLVGLVRIKIAGAIKAAAIYAALFVGISVVIDTVGD